MTTVPPYIDASKVEAPNNVHAIGGHSRHRVTLHKDPVLEYPEFWLEVFIADDSLAEQIAFAEMFVRARCTRAPSPLEADLVVFTGGPDVNPIFYGETPHPTTKWDTRRDEADIKIYEQCYNAGIPMFGVCRGAQFLHVMNGGKLWQDVDGHVGDHTLWDVKTRHMVQKISSVHHQMCRPNPEGGMILLADSMKARNRWGNESEHVTGTHPDVEAFFYRDTHCLGVQGHPEYRGYHEFMKWTLDQINEYIVCSPDTELQGEGRKYRRLKKSFLEERYATQQKKLEEMN